MSDTPDKAEPDYSKPLRGKMEAFVQAYLFGEDKLNATWAAITAGYSQSTARQMGSENLSKPDIRGRLAYLQAEQFKRLHMSADEVLAEAAKVARFNLGKGLHFGYDDVPVIDLHQLDMNDLAALSSIETTTRTRRTGRGDDQAVIEDRTTTVKTHSKVAAVNLLMRHHKLLTDKVELAPSDDFAELLSAGHKRAETMR